MKEAKTQSNIYSQKRFWIQDNIIQLYFCAFFESIFCCLFDLGASAPDAFAFSAASLNFWTLYLFLEYLWSTWACLSCWKARCFFMSSVISTVSTDRSFSGLASTCLLEFWWPAASEATCSAVESAMRPFLCLPSFNGNKISLLLYSLSLSTFLWRASSFAFFLLWSVAIPTVLAKVAVSPAALSSWKENPFPYLSIPLYFLVCPETIGLSFEIGLGKTFLAVDFLARYLLCFLAGWLNQVLTNLPQCFLKWTFGSALLCLTIINNTIFAFISFLIIQNFLPFNQIKFSCKSIIYKDYKSYIYQI